MPNRVLRDWTTSETIDKLSQGAEVFFTRLIMKADDFGNYTANLKLLKAALFPLKDYSESLIGSWLNECCNIGVIHKYDVDNKEYLNIPNFGQRLRAMKSQYPVSGSSNGGHMSDNGRLETKGNETEEEKNTNIKMLGSKSDYFITVIPNQLHEQKYKVFGKDGLSELFLNLPGGGKLNYPEHAEKFMKSRTSKQFNSIMHVWNDYNNKFIPSIYK